MLRLVDQFNTDFQTKQIKQTDIINLRDHINTFLSKQRVVLLKMAQKHIALNYAHPSTKVRKRIIFCFKARIFPLEAALTIAMVQQNEYPPPNAASQLSTALRQALRNTLYLYNFRKTFSMGPYPRRIHHPDHVTTKAQNTTWEREYDHCLNNNTECNVKTQIPSVVVKTDSFRPLSFQNDTTSWKITIKYCSQGTDANNKME